MPTGAVLLRLGVETPVPQSAPVDTDRPHFEVIHSLFKQTVARVGLTKDGEGIALEFLLEDDKQAEEVRRAVAADLKAKLERLSPQASSLDALFRLFRDSCCHPSNMYTEVHWCPVDPALLPD